VKERSVQVTAESVVMRTANQKSKKGTQVGRKKMKRSCSKNKFCGRESKMTPVMTAFPLLSGENVPFGMQKKDITKSNRAG
jgi:hypothetical protein